MFTFREDDTIEKLREQKAVELEQRRDAMVKKTDQKRFQRSLHEQRREALKAEALLQSHNIADEKLHEIRQTYLLAEELSRRKREEIKIWLETDKRRLPYNPSHCDLSDIRSQLLQKKMREESRHDGLISHWYCDDEYLKEQEKEAHRKKLNYRRDLQNQLIDNRRRLREEMEEKHRERKIVEEIVDRMHEEDEQLEKRKREFAAYSLAEEEAFQKARQMWKGKRMEFLRKEHDDIERMIAEKELEVRRAAEKKSDVTAAKEEASQRIARKMSAEAAKKREREEICRELYLAEQDAAIAQEEIKAVLKKNRVAGELLNDMEAHHKAAAERKAKENAIDIAFAKYYADERKALEKKERQKDKERQERKMHYGRELRETITRNKVWNALDILELQSHTNRNGENVGKINARDKKSYDDEIPKDIGDKSAECC